MQELLLVASRTSALFSTHNIDMKIPRPSNILRLDIYDVYARKIVYLQIDPDMLHEINSTLDSTL